MLARGATAGKPVTENLEAVFCLTALVLRVLFFAAGVPAGAKPVNTDPLFQTPICRRLGIQYPIFQAGMGFVAHAEVAAAVSNAGGLGCIGSGSMGSRK